MKFRGAERVMRLLQEHEPVLDISSRLTPVDCEVESMQQVDTIPGRADRERLIRMMEHQQMGQSRRDKWLQFIENGSLA
jgi:hypothetical protein